MGLVAAAPTSTTQDHQPHGTPRGRHRTPSPSPAKLRPTRRAWLLLWLTAALSGVTVDQLVWRVLAVVRPGGIVLLHDGGNRSATVAALPATIDGLRRLGLTLTVLPQLIPAHWLAAARTLVSGLSSSMHAGGTAGRSTP